MPIRRRFVSGAVLLAVALSLASCASGPGTDDGLKGVRPIRYGDAPSQLGELLLPNELGPYPVVVLIHGGWWRESDFDRRLMRDLADDLADEGYATWNLEYRLIGQQGAGWPGTFEDIADGIDLLADIGPEENLDLSRVVVIGHSAGGTLALWSGARDDLPKGAVGADPAVVPSGVVALAPVTHLAATAVFNLGAGAVSDLMGGLPDEVPERYARASPVELVPFDPRLLIIHGTDDDVLPLSQSLDFVELSHDAGDNVEMLALDGVDHFDVIDRDSDAWQSVLDHLPQLSKPRPADDS